MEVPQTVVFNGVEYRLMGAGRYYLSQSKTNEGRRGAKGLHVAVWEFYSGQTVPPGYEIHHKDGNTFNNDFSNLECIPRDEHRKISDYKSSGKVQKHLDEVRPLAAAWHSSPEGHEWHKQHAKESINKYTPRACVCEFCGKSFEAPVGRKYCSHNCAVKADYRSKERREMRECVVCGKQFEAKIHGRDPGARTCSFSCRTKLRNSTYKKKSLQSDG